MNVYQIKSIPETFKALQLGPIEMAQQLNKMDELKLLVNFPAMNASLLPFWKEIESEFDAESPSATELPDISLWTSAALVMNQYAHKKLETFLSHEGEFLPIKVGAEKMYLFNCLEYGKENRNQTLIHYIDGVPDGVEILVFDEQDIEKRLVFKSQLQGGSVLYCSSAFKGLCHELDLRGLRFDENLIDPF